MGRLDKFYSDKNISLDEEKDHSKQFIQIIDETGVEAPLRLFLEEHCTDDWQKIFHRDMGKIRDALKTAATQPTLKEQMVAFIRGVNNVYSSPAVYVYTMPEHSGSITPGIAPLLNFAKNVATKVFPNDPLGFSHCFEHLDRMQGSHFLLLNAQWFYGKDFFLKPEYIRTMDEEALWRLFENLFNRETNSDENAFGLYLKKWDNTHKKAKTLYSLTTGDFIPLKFVRTFLEIQIDRQAPKESFASLDRIINRLQNKRLNLSETQNFYEWRKAVCSELEIFWCLNALVKEKAFEIEDEWAELYHKNYLFFVPEQPRPMIHAMIKWSLKKDLPGWMCEKGFSLLSDRFNSGDFSRFWYSSPYKEEWSNEFYHFLNLLPTEQRCLVLIKGLGTSVSFFREDLPNGITPPNPDHKDSETFKQSNNVEYSYRIAKEDIDAYNSFFRSFIESREIPKDLCFNTVIKRINNSELPTRFVINLSNKILGQLRGYVATNDLPIPLEELDKIWRTLELHDPQKALFHRMMLLRASLSPCCDDKLEVTRSSISPLTAKEIVQRLSRNHIRNGESIEVSSEDICKWFAEYCISRLQLRKKEKAGKDGYCDDQVMETSPIWREGYLHALSEIGIDLGGRIHKIAHFIRKHDPNQDVRDTAEKCYKASRRKHIKNKDSIDVIRSLIAAYWWLLMAHMESLEQKIDHEGALLTRRRQLRR